MIAAFVVVAVVVAFVVSIIIAVVVADVVVVQVGYLMHAFGTFDSNFGQ